ncbi:MAG: hypothetical protein H7833_18535 [Magnetococcus sp. DMHC-1]
MSSQAFRPTPKDKSLLSVYDGNKIEAGSAWNHYTGVLRLASLGVMGIAEVDIEGLNLGVRADPLPDFPEHAVIDFSGFTKNQVEKKAKQLRDRAEAMGWLYRA